MQHTHSWRRLKANRFQCCHATCYSKMTLEHLEGKLAQCPICGKHFVIFLKDVRSTDPILNCPDCKTGEYHLTLEGRSQVLQELAMQDIRRISEAANEAIMLREETLRRKEVALDNRERKLAKRETDLDAWFANQEEEFKRKLTWYGEQCAHLKTRRENITLQLRKRRELIRLERDRLKLLQDKVEPANAKTGEAPTSEQIGASIMLNLEEILLGKKDENDEGIRPISENE